MCDFLILMSSFGRLLLLLIMFLWEPLLDNLVSRNIDVSTMLYKLNILFMLFCDTHRLVPRPRLHLFLPISLQVQRREMRRKAQRRQHFLLYINMLRIYYVKV